MGQDHNGVTDQKTAEGMSSSISAPVHLPIYRSKTKYGIIRSIDMTWTIRLRYRKPSSIESDIGGGLIDPDIGSKDQMDQ